MSGLRARVAVLQPRLDGRGGAEKYGAALIQAVAGRMPLDVISEHSVDPRMIEHAFNLRLEGPRFRCDPRCHPAGPACERLTTREAEAAYASVTREYDLVIGNTLSLPWPSAARRSILVCHFPCVREERVPPGGRLDPWWTSRGRLQRHVRRRVDSWSRIVTSSRFAARFISRYWNREADVVHPAVEVPAGPLPEGKRPWIIGVGFFSRPGGPCGERWSYKRQEVLLEAFRSLCDRGLEGWELHLAGHVLPPTPETYARVDELRRGAAEYPVHFHPDCSYQELEALYRRGSLFWHATGYGLNEEAHPDQMEHFGMVTVEAMGWGCVPLVIAQGGQPEIVEHRRSGFLWNTLEELQEMTLLMTRDESARAAAAAEAARRAAEFAYPRFARQVVELVASELDSLRGEA